MQSVPQHNYQPQAQVVSNPPLNEAREVMAGEEMIRQSAHVMREMIYVDSEQTVSMYRVAPGYYKKIGDSVDGDYFQPAGGPDGGSITQTGIADVPQALMTRKDSGDLCVVTIFDFPVCDRPKAQVTFASAEGYERRKRADGGDAFQSLVYSGMDGSRVAVTYFGTSGGLPVTARVTHDLHESPILSYRGARIEILQATSGAIKYRVIQPLGD